MSTPDLHRLEQLLERWEYLEEDDQKPWLEALRTEDEATWNVFLRMAGESGKTRVDAISRRLWTSLDLEAGRIGQTIH